MRQEASTCPAGGHFRTSSCREKSTTRVSICAATRGFGASLPARGGALAGLRVCAHLANSAGSELDGAYSGYEPTRAPRCSFACSALLGTILH